MGRKKRGGVELISLVKSLLLIVPISHLFGWVFEISFCIHNAPNLFNLTDCPVSKIVKSQFESNSQRYFVIRVEV